jgi:hypothetical protein
MDAAESCTFIVQLSHRRSGLSEKKCRVFLMSNRTLLQQPNRLCTAEALQKRKACRIHNTFGVDISLARWPQGSSFLATLGFDPESRWDIKPSAATRSRTKAQSSSFFATLGFDPESRWDIKPSTATRSRTKAQGWTEERGTTLGIQKAAHHYTEGVMQKDLCAQLHKL